MTDGKKFVLITVDDLRRDRTSLEQERDTTPFLKSFAQNNFYQENHFSNGSVSPTSFRSIFTSSYPHEFNDRDYLNENRPYLPDILSNEVRSVGLSTNPFVSEFYGFEKGYDNFVDATLESSHDDSVLKMLKQNVKDFVKTLPFSSHLRVIRDRFRGRGTPYMEGEEVVRNAQELLDEDDSDEATFYWFHFMDTHSPFVPPEETRGTWSDFESRRDVWRNLEKDEPEQLLELYDECMLYLDRNLEKLVEILEEKFEEDEFEILITSDHGELFYDEDWGAHGHPNMLKEKLFEVPLFTTFELGRKFSTHVDIVPTILDFFDVDAQEGIRGLSLFSDEGKNHDFVETDSNGNEWLDQKWRDKRAAKIDKNGIVETVNITKDEEPEDEDLKSHLERIGEKEGSSKDESDLSEEEEEKVKENLRQLGYDEKIK